MDIRHLWWRVRLVQHLRSGGWIKRWRFAAIASAWVESGEYPWTSYYDGDFHPADAVIDEYHPHSHP
jgi:hypothetical protein